MTEETQDWMRREIIHLLERIERDNEMIRAAYDMIGQLLKENKAQRDYIADMERGYVGEREEPTTRPFAVGDRVMRTNHDILGVPDGSTGTITVCNDGLIWVKWDHQQWGVTPYTVGNAAMLLVHA